MFFPGLKNESFEQGREDKGEQIFSRIHQSLKLLKLLLFINLDNNVPPRLQIFIIGIFRGIISNVNVF